jgi:hypothetical protein
MSVYDAPLIGDIARGAKSLISGIDWICSSKERRLKNTLQDMGLITKEDRKLLDDGKAKGFAKGDAGMNEKLQYIAAKNGIDPSLIHDICTQLGVPRRNVDVQTW